MNNAKGFTLVEVLVTVVIVAILAAVAIPRYNSYVKNAQISEGQSMCQLIGAAVIQVHNNGTTLTGTSDWTDLGITNPSDNNWSYSFPDLAGTASLTNTYAISATGKSGPVNTSTGTFLPLQTGTAQWTGIL
jgi:prepilin-type N-terminal cleavage/methylation domain-containing protein